MIVIPAGGLKWRAPRRLLSEALCHLALPASACGALSWHERVPTILEQILCLFFSRSAVCSADVAHNTVEPSHMTETFHCRLKPSSLHSGRRMNGFYRQVGLRVLTLLPRCGPVLVCFFTLFVLPFCPNSSATDRKSTKTLTVYCWQ